MRNCITCSHPTTNKKFCTRSCSAKHNNLLHIAPKRKSAPKMCRRCKKHFHRSLLSKGNCQTCQSEIKENKLRTRKMTLGEFQKKYEERGIHKSWWHSEIRSLAREMSKHRPRICQTLGCGYSVHIECAHIKAISSFGPGATVEEINQEANIAILCRNHHWEFDHGLLQLSDLSN